MNHPALTHELGTLPLDSGERSPHTVPPEALESLARELQTCRQLARADQQAYGEHGAYAVATLYHALYLDQAHDHLSELQEWLAQRAHVEPPLRSSLAAYQIHSYLRELVLALHYARHWAMLSASHHHSRAAADAFEYITRLIQRAEVLSEHAGRAYLNAPQAQFENFPR